ncbi:MAG: YraN family protein [Pseudobdellovibrionaceae bacterium]
MLLKRSSTSKNPKPSKHKKSQPATALLGFESERKVIAYLEKNRHWKLAAQRVRTPFAEIDLVFRTSYGFALVEVKTLWDKNWVLHRLSMNQARRLKNALMWFSEKRPTSLHLAFVYRGSTEVLVIDENFGA